MEPEMRRGNKMKSVRIIGLIIAFTVLLYGTILVFQAFDLHSHSASDTLRPFLITMAPVWTIAIIGATILLYERQPSSDQ